MYCTVQLHRTNLCVHADADDFHDIPYKMLEKKCESSIRCSYG